MDEMHLIRRLAARLQQRGAHLAIAESSTGGLLGHWLTEMPGSSAYFLGSVVAYADSLKERILGVPPETIARNGAVSAATACAMARGVRRLTGAEIGLALTGIAGPEGGRPGKPIGTVYIAAVVGSTCWVWRHGWHSRDRRANKRRSAAAAIADLLLIL